MSAEFPEELAGKRDDILQRATARGTKLRMRRRAAVVASLVLVFSALAGTVAVVASGSHANRVVTSEPDATTSTSDEATSSTVAAATATVSTEAPAPPTTSASDTTFVPVTSEPVTTVLVCHNSSDPRCGPMTLVPAPVNQPLELRVEQTVTGDTLHMRVYGSDDTAVDPCMSISWGDGESSYGPGPTVGCVALGVCAIPEPRFGPWDPPPPTPETIHVDYTHVYKHADTFAVTINAGSAASCSPDQFYASTAKKIVDVTIKPAPTPTTKPTTTTTAA